jgi:hypothetical protein
MFYFIFAIVCGLFEWKRICAEFFLLFVYICIAIGDPFIKRGIPLTGLKAPHLRACLKPGSGFSMSHVFVFIVFNGLR